MICPKCGKELNEGEVCSCSQDTQDTQNTQAQSGLPDGKVVLEGVKTAAKAVKNSPFIAELLYTAKGMFTVPEKQVADNSERTDILWVLMLPIEALMTAFGITAILRQILFAATKATGVVSSTRGFTKAMKTLGLSTPKMFGVNFLWAVACIFVCIIAVMLFASVCKKKKGFSEAANLITTAVMPSAVFMAAAGVGALAYVPLGLLLAATAGMSAVLLGYGASEAAGGKRAFWLYILFAFVVLAICAAMEVGLLKALTNSADTLLK